MAGVALPKGVFSRGRRDFLIADMAYGHVDNASGVANATVSLFNNATDGTVLGLVGIVAIKASVNGTIFIRLQSGTLGAFVTNASPLRLGDPLPVGQFFMGTDVASVASNARNILGFAQGNQGGQWFGADPCLLIRPGFSLICGMDLTTHFCMNFWFTQE